MRTTLFSKCRRSCPSSSCSTPPARLTVARRDVLSQLNSTRALFTSYLRIRSLSTTTGKPSPELASAHKELSTSLTALAEDLADLVESVKAVRDDPYKYGLEIEEVSRRQRLVDEVGDEVADMREELAKSVHTEPGGYKTPVVDDEERRDYNEEFEQQQQLTMMREQDQDLDGVFRTVGNLRQQADDMGRELEEQAEILENVDGLADRVGGRLQGGLKKMSEVVKKNEDGLSSCCIAVLIFILILLLVLLLVL
jgi:t-SNARE syntaxin family protein